MAARSLGRSPRQVLREVYAPLVSGPLASALLLVFVDCVKELPATLLLRPFNYDTLATRVHAKASLENIAEAAPAAEAPEPGTARQARQRAALVHGVHDGALVRQERLGRFVFAGRLVAVRLD